MSDPAKKLADLRDVALGVAQSLWTLAAVLKDREMPHTSSSAGDLAEMLGEAITASEREQ